MPKKPSELRQKIRECYKNRRGDMAQASYLVTDLLSRATTGELVALHGEGIGNSIMHQLQREIKLRQERGLPSFHQIADHIDDLARQHPGMRITLPRHLGETLIRHWDRRFMEADPLEMLKDYAGLLTLLARNTDVSRVTRLVFLSDTLDPDFVEFTDAHSSVVERVFPEKSTLAKAKPEPKDFFSHLTGEDWI